MPEKLYSSIRYDNAHLFYVQESFTHTKKNTLSPNSLKRFARVVSFYPGKWLGNGVALQQQVSCERVAGSASTNTLDSRVALPLHHEHVPRKHI